MTKKTENGEVTLTGRPEELLASMRKDYRRNRIQCWVLTGMIVGLVLVAARAAVVAVVRRDSSMLIDVGVAGIAAAILIDTRSVCRAIDARMRGYIAEVEARVASIQEERDAAPHRD